MLRFLLILAVSVSFAGGALPALARDASVVRAELLMGQKARLHKMSKSVCYLIAGADRALLSKAANTAAEGFDEALMTLQEGGGAADLPPEADPDMQAALRDLYRQSRGVILSARQIVAGDLHHVPMTLFLEGGPDTEARLTALENNALPALVSGAEQGISFAAFRALQDQSARLQALLRDTCLLQVGLLSAAGKAQFLASFELFETELTALRDGAARRGIPAPPNVSARVLLDKIATFWAKARPTLVAATQGQPIEMRALQKASIFADLMDKSFAKAKGHYWGG